MSDTFEFSIPEQNQAGNFPADKMSPDAIGDRAAASTSAPAAQTSTSGAASPGERRSRRRALISAPVRVRSVDLTEGGPEKFRPRSTFRAAACFSRPKMPNSKPAWLSRSRFRTANLPSPYRPSNRAAWRASRNCRTAAIPWPSFCDPAPARTSWIPADADSMRNRHPKLFIHPSSARKKPLVIVVDQDTSLRETLKAYLTGEGYDVIALSSAAEAHHVLEMFTPALLIAEIEGEDLPGYELCAYVKATPRLQTVPVMLMTSSAYPSDYANAHSLGAVVCIAKPYRQERLGHVVRLLAPTRQAKALAAPARPGDTSRKSCNGNATKAPGYSPNIRFRPSW